VPTSITITLMRQRRPLESHSHMLPDTVSSLTHTSQKHAVSVTLGGRQGLTKHGQTTKAWHHRGENIGTFPSVEADCKGPASTSLASCGSHTT